MNISSTSYKILTVTLFGIVTFFLSSFFPLWVPIVFGYISGAFTVGQWIGKKSILIWKQKTPIWKAVWFFPVTVISTQWAHHSSNISSPVSLDILGTDDVKGLAFGWLVLELSGSHYGLRNITKQKHYVGLTMAIWPLRIMSMAVSLIFSSIMVSILFAAACIWRIPKVFSRQLAKELEE